MSDWTWRWWLDVQTLPGNILGDAALGVAGYYIGKLHEKRAAAREHRAEQRHQEHLDQAERHHLERLAQAAEHHTNLINHVNTTRRQS